MPQYFAAPWRVPRSARSHPPSLASLTVSKQHRQRRLIRQHLLEQRGGGGTHGVHRAVGGHAARSVTGQRVLQLPEAGADLSGQAAAQL